MHSWRFVFLFGVYILAKRRGRNTGLGRDLPMDALQAGPNSAVSGPARAEFPAARGSALIADDDPVFSALMEQVLHQHGARSVTLACDGEEALAAIRQMPGGIDTIILDLSMPNLDGVRFLRKLAELGFKGRIAVVSGEKSQVRESARKLAAMLGLNCTGVFPKPVDFDAVAAHVLASADKPAQAGPRAPIEPEEFNAALRRSSLMSFYQPRVELATGRIVGAEALARMSDSRGELLDAAQMINFAERNGRISDITWRMVEIVTQDAARMRRDIPEALEISFNISASILENDGFPAMLGDIVHQSGLAPHDFVLELTETRIPLDRARSLEALTVLRMQGFGLAIDDFGTGYSNLEQLRMFPFSELKIDRGFMSAAGHDGFALACVEASVALARELGLSIVAEGVESSVELAIAKKYRVDLIQGFLIGKPMPISDFMSFVAKGPAPVGHATPVLRQAG